MSRVYVVCFYLAVVSAAFYAFLVLTWTPGSLCPVQAVFGC